MQKIWTFVKNATSKPDFKDVLEGVVCLVSLRGEREILLRVRRGDKSYSTDLDGHPLQSVGAAGSYTFLAYYGTPPVEPLPATLRDAKPYQLVNLKTMDRLYWYDSNNMVWSLREDGTAQPEVKAGRVCMQFAVTSVSNLTAVLTEV